MLFRSPYRLQHPYNIYHSVAKYIVGIPNQTLNFYDKSRSEVNQDWKGGTHHKNIYTYDFVVDIDAPSHDYMDIALESAKKLHKFYMYHGIPHEIRFTGMGFHFIVPDCGGWTKDYSPDLLNSLYRQFTQLAILLHNNISEMIDLKIYDSRRVVKCPYTLSIYDDKAYLCWTFMTTLELVDFDYNLMEIKKPLDFSKIIKSRGTFMFNQGCDSTKILDLKWQKGVFKLG